MWSIRASAASASTGLALIGHAEPGRLDHRQVVGPSPDRQAASSPMPSSAAAASSASRLASAPTMAAAPRR
jgi:hypothetical protein